jgi:uncharacterized membrane protein required for colicin V production
MFNLMDIVVIAIVALSGFFGYKRGFIKTAISLFSFFIAIGIALLFYKPVAVILTEKTQIDDWIIERICDYDYEADKEDSNKNESKAIASSEEETEQGIIETLSEQFPQSILESFDFEKTKRDLKLEAATKISESIMKVLSVIIIFLVIKVTLFVASFILNGIVQMPVLKQLNEILGLFFGAIMGFLELYIAFAIITFISSITDLTFVTDALKGSLIASIMFENNIILKLLF